MSDAQRVSPSEAWRLPTGPVWEAAKLEPLWCSYRVIAREGQKPQKMPYGSDGKSLQWNQNLVPFAEAVANMERYGHHGVGYQPGIYDDADGKPQVSAMVIVDFDEVTEDPDLMAQANRWIEHSGYWERSASGLGFHGLIPRPGFGSDWTMDGAHGWLGYLGSGSKYCALTFDAMFDGAEVAEIPNLYAALCDARQQDLEGRTKAAPTYSEREMWWKRLTSGDLEAMLREAVSHIRLKPGESDGWRRDTWMKVGMTLKLLHPDIGEAVFMEWSRSQPGYAGEEDTARNWRDMHPDGTIQPPSLFYYAGEDFDVRKWQAKAAPYDDSALRAEFNKVMAELAARKTARKTAREGSDDPEADEDPYSTAALRKVKLDRRPHLIRNLIAPRMTYFAGDPKSGKSFAAMQMAEAIGTGQALWGCEVPQKHRVLYYAAENGYEETATRIQRMELEGDVIWRFRGIHFEDLPESVEELLLMLGEECLADPSIRVVFLDTLRFMAGPPKKTDGNAQDRDFAQLLPIQAWSDQTGIAVVCVAHTNKPPGGGGRERTLMEAIAGSNLIMATAEAVVGLKRIVDAGSLDPTPYGVVQRQGRGFDQDGRIEVTFDRTTTTFATSSGAEVNTAKVLSSARAGSTKATILRLLGKDHGEAATPAEKMEQTRFRLARHKMIVLDGGWVRRDDLRKVVMGMRGVGSGTVRTNLKDLEDIGAIETRGDSKGTSAYVRKTPIGA